MYYNALRNIAQACMLHVVQQHLHDPGILSGSADQCIRGNVYLIRSNLFQETALNESSVAQLGSSKQT